MNSRLIQILSFVVVLSGWMQAAAAELSAPLKQMLETEFDTVVRLEKLLPAVMANPNEDFNPSDVSNGTPTRRLIVAGHSSKCDFVCYEHGGIGYHLHLVIFSNEKDGTRRTFEGLILKRAKDAATVADIKKLIQSGNVPDNTVECESNPGF